MKKKILALLLTLAMTAALAACGPDAGQTGASPTGAPTPDDSALTALFSGDMLADFSNGPADTFFASGEWTNGGMFNVWWTGRNATYANGLLSIVITDASNEVRQDYYAAEVRSYLNYGYGDYIVSMRPAKIAGTVSSFFTYTGPSEIGLDGSRNPWDEIDIEFLGTDTTGVQFNYFVNGQGGHEYWYELGFDASEEFHEYGFRWAEDFITWYVDGEPVHTVTADADHPMPSTPSRIMVNHWCGTADIEGWLGPYVPGDDTADYQWIKTSAEGISLRGR